MQINSNDKKHITYCDIWECMTSNSKLHFTPGTSLNEIINVLSDDDAI